MDFQVIFQTSRKVMIELQDSGIFYTEPYDIYIDGTWRMQSNRIVQTIEGLCPDTEYELMLKRGDRTLSLCCVRTDYEFVTLNVRDFGAKGDGIHDDTAAIQAAVSACPPKSRVLVPEGIYKVSSVFLKSHLTLELEKGAVLSAFTEREKFAVLPGMITSADGLKEYNLGTWEGEPVSMFSAVLTGMYVSDVVITGEGMIDGNAGYDNWWHDFRTIVGACRPRMIFLNHCENVVLHGFTTQNTPAWNIHPYFSKNIRMINLNILNPKISPNTDGMDPESCDGVEIVGVYFSVGDDCIAVKSGKIYMGKNYKQPSQNIEIRQCCMKDGHGSVTLGSEIGAGVRNIRVHDCLFIDTDRGLRIKTRRGRGEDSVIEDVIFENIVMKGVLSPFVVNSFYWDCDPDGHTDYVGTKQALPVDERMPEIRRLVFRNIKAEDTHVCGIFIYGLPEQKIGEVIMEHIDITYTDAPQEEFPAMMAGVEKVTKKGIYVNNVKRLSMNHITVSGQDGAAWNVYHVDEFIRDGKRCKNTQEAPGEWIET